MCRLLPSQALWADGRPASDHLILTIKQGKVYDISWTIGSDQGWLCLSMGHIRDDR